MLLRFASWRWLLAGVIFWLSAPGARAQAVPPHGYDFLTVLTVESPYKAGSAILITPAFQNRTEIPLLDITPQYGPGKRAAELLQNTATVNQLLGELTLANWELFQVYPISPNSGAGSNPVATRYLFRKPRP